MGTTGRYPTPSFTKGSGVPSLFPTCLSRGVWKVTNPFALLTRLFSPDGTGHHGTGSPVTPLPHTEGPWSTPGKTYPEVGSPDGPSRFPGLSLHPVTFWSLGSRRLWDGVLMCVGLEYYFSHQLYPNGLKCLFICSMSKFKLTVHLLYIQKSYTIYFINPVCDLEKNKNR